MCQIFCKAVLVDKETGSYNVGTGILVTLEEQIKIIAEVFGGDKKSDFVYCPEKLIGKSFRGLFLIKSPLKFQKPLRANQILFNYFTSFLSSAYPRN